MSANKQVIIGLVMVSLAVCVGFAGNAHAWGEDTPYGDTNVWLSDYEYCNPAFNVRFANFNTSYPNALNYTLTYTLQYRDKNNIIQDESINVQTFNTTLNAVQHPIFSHFICVNTVMNILSEIEEGTTEDGVTPLRRVLVELDYDWCDTGGCSTGDDIIYIDFTGCDPSSGTSYGDPLTPETDEDYGFDLGGRGSDGGSGSIYEGIDLYGSTGDESGMGAGFGWIFFGLIPIIFLFSVFKFCRRVLWGED